MEEVNRWMEGWKEVNGSRKGKLGDREREGWIDRQTGKQIDRASRVIVMPSTA